MSKRILFIINIIWSWLCCFYAPYFFSIKFDSLDITNSIFSLVFIVAIVILLNKIHFDNKRKVVLTHLLGFIYALLTGIGHQLDTYGFTNLRGLLIPVILYCHLFAAVIVMIWQWLENAELWLNKNSVHKTIWTWLHAHQYIITIILLLCWLPCFLSDFPGGFRHDAAAELDQAYIPQYNPAFPLLHSVIITHFLPFIYRLTGSYNIGIAIYTIIQMILIAILYTHIINNLYKKEINGLVLDLILIYMGLLPTIAVLVEFAGRDMLFTGLLIYTLALIYELLIDKDYFFKNYSKPIVLGVVLPLTVYARNNSSTTLFLITMVVIAGIVIIYHINDYPTKAISFGVCCITCYILLSFVLTSLCQPMVSSNSKKVVRERMGIYTQTLSRAYIYDNDEWTKEELDELCRYVDPRILAQYSPTLSDRARESLFVLEDNKKAFLKFWWRIGKKHIGTYIDAILLCSQPAWDPSTVLYGYVTARPAGYYGREKMYFSIAPETEEPPAKPIDLLPAVNKYYQHIGLDISFEKIPMLSLLFSIGFHFWFVMNAFFYLLYRKVNKTNILVGGVFLYCIICSFAPIILVRYFALLFFATPIILAFILEPIKTSYSNE